MVGYKAFAISDFKRPKTFRSSKSNLDDIYTLFQ